MSAPSLHTLEVFRIVVAERSITGAARRLHISQPAVSSLVKGLEAWVGRRLLERTARGVVPTRWGELVAERAARILTAVEELQSLGEALSGRLRLAASTTPGTYLLPTALRSFQSLYPEIEVELTVTNSARVVEEVAAERAALGVLGELPSTAPDLVWEPWGRDRLQLVAPAGSRLAQATKVRPEELAGEVLLLREPGSSSRAQAESLLGPLLHAFGRRLQPGSTEVIKESVIAGLGLAVLSSLATRREEQAGLLAPVAGLSTERIFYLLSPPVERAEAPARRLRTHLLSG